MGKTCYPDPFSRRQQLQSRLDGGEEIDGSKRQLLEVTPPEPQGHVVRERILADAELRSCRNIYRQVPLTGCQQSMLPRYRLPQSFGRIEVPDDHGLWGDDSGAPDPVASAAAFSDASAPWIEADDGSICSFRLPNGAEASDEDLQRDSEQWGRAFARDVRSCISQNHDHDCTDTCVKYAAKGPVSNGDKAKTWNVPPCRFQFFVVLVFAFLEGAREVVRNVLRRGKALVTCAYIACTNERNEYGSFVPERHHPLRSSTSDVHQAIFRCNGDVQFKDRCVPEADVTSESAAVTDSSEGLFFGCRGLSHMQRAVLHYYAVALKASSVADFYMTKYQSKAQQVLSAAMASTRSWRQKWLLLQIRRDRFPNWPEQNSAAWSSAQTRVTGSLHAS